MLEAYLLTTSLCAPSLFCRPWADGHCNSGGPRGNPVGKLPGDHGGPAPHQRFSVLPDWAKALVIGGLTY